MPRSRSSNHSQLTVTRLTAFTILALALLPCTDSPATTSVWHWQNPLPHGNPLLDVAFTDANTGTAVGAVGMILRTTDGGATWVNQVSDTSAGLFAVSFTDANTGTVMGEDGTILGTADGGATWISQASSNGNTLRGVSFADACTGTVVGNYGTILRGDNTTVAVFITGFRADPVENGIALTWSMISDEHVQGFQLYRSGGADATERVVNDHLIAATTRSYVDVTTLPGNRYRYTLVVLGAESGELRSAPVEVERPPLTMQLFQNRPNPFNPAT